MKHVDPGEHVLDTCIAPEPRNLSETQQTLGPPGCTNCANCHMVSCGGAVVCAKPAHQRRHPFKLRVGSTERSAEAPRQPVQPKGSERSPALFVWSPRLFFSPKPERDPPAVGDVDGYREDHAVSFISDGAALSERLVL